MDGVPIEKLRRDHPTETFDCGNAARNTFLARHALQSQQAGASQTYVAVEGERIVGYQTLVFGEAAFEDAPERLRKGVARHPVPLMVLARLAVAEDQQGQGLGARLLKDTFTRTLQAAEIAGLRALLVHAKDHAARRFYQHFDFAPSSTDPLHLFVLLKDVRRAIGRP